jgi:hypothetical protein
MRWPLASTVAGVFVPLSATCLCLGPWFGDEGSVLLEQVVQLTQAAGDLRTAVAALREHAYADSSPDDVPRRSAR